MPIDFNDSFVDVPSRREAGAAPKSFMLPVVGLVELRGLLAEHVERLELYDDMGASTLAVSIMVPCVRSRKRIEVCTSEMFSIPHRPEHAKQFVERQLFDVLRRVMIHEVEEGLFVEGKQLVDPHPEEVR